jgi:hypothetical protein
MGLFRNRAAETALKNMQSAQSELKSRLANRQAIIDPYANVRDLSSMISNPFANLQVSTAAAEMQAAEQDISLAASLDALRATGAAAGGATALAQASLRGKQDVATSIEQQEAQNARLRAQGEQQAIQMRMAEAQRQQEADVYGKTFQFQAQEQRDVADISRAAAMQQQYAQQYQDAKERQSNLFGSILGAGASILTAGVGGGGSVFGKIFGLNS